MVHDDVADMCWRAAAVVGLDVCGIDVRLADITAPMRCSGHSAADHEAGPGAVIEINACPGLRMHLSPAEGAPRDVAGAVIDSLYPPGAPSRVPVVAVTGTNGKTTTVRMIGHILGQAGMRVGMSTTDGVYSGGRLVYEADASGPRSAEMVLDDTSVEAAVLETARGGIIRGGLGYDQADVAVVTNITADHLGADGMDDLDEMVGVKALIAEEVREGGGRGAERRRPGGRGHRRPAAGAQARARDQVLQPVGRQPGHRAAPCGPAASPTSCATASWSSSTATGSGRCSAWPSCLARSAGVPRT